MTDDERLDLEVRLARELFADVERGSWADEPTVSERDEEILRGILAERDAVAASTVVVASGWRRRRRWVATAAGIAAATAAIVTASTLSPSATPPAHADTPAMLTSRTADVKDVLDGRAPAARDTLLSIADRTGTLPSVERSDGTQRVTSFAWFLNGTADGGGQTTDVLAPKNIVTELHADGSMHNVEHTGPSLDLDGRVIDPHRYTAAGPESEDDIPAGTLDAALPWTLPRDNAALKAALLAQMGTVDCSSAPQRAACLFSAIQGLYVDWVVPSDLSAAMWRVLANEPDVRLLGKTTDRLGRTGQAIAVLTSAEIGEVDVMVISPRTGQLLEWEQTSVTPDRSSVVSFQALISSEVVEPND